MTLATDSLIVDGVRLAYRTRGQGEPVIFIHGTPSHSYEWRDVVPHVETAGFQVVTYDLLGFGRSERPVDRDTSVAAQTELLGYFLDALGIERANFIAHDIGGAIGLRFALAHPGRVSRLMLIDTVSYDSWPSSSWRKIIQEHRDDWASMPQDSFNAMLTRQLEMTVTGARVMRGDVLRAYLEPHQSTLGRASFFEHQVRHYDSTYTMEISDELARLTMPVRVLWGQEDRWQPLHYARRLSEAIPNADLVVVPGAGHFLMEDDPDRVVQEIRGLLRTSPG